MVNGCPMQWRDQSWSWTIDQTDLVLAWGLMTVGVLGMTFSLPQGGCFCCLSMSGIHGKLGVQTCLAGDLHALIWGTESMAEGCVKKPLEA